MTQRPERVSVGTAKTGEFLWNDYRSCPFKAKLRVHASVGGLDIPKRQSNDKRSERQFEHNYSLPPPVFDGRRGSR
jgi:hypothetical protein